MGKDGGFLEYGRKEPGYRQKRQRLKDYNEVELRLSEEELTEQAARCMDCGVPFCHGCGCPLSNVIPEFNDMLYRHQWEDALEILMETNRFPEFTGRICPAPCEASCVLGINDEPVTIRQIELAIIEKAFEKGYIKPSIPSERTGTRVAVIGSGPAGLAVADALNQLGHEVTVFEKDRKVGGILRYGIPDFKLEKSVIDRRVKLMREEGIVFERGVVVGKDISFAFVMDRFDAVCLAGGAREPRDLKVPGRELKGTYFAMEFLRCQNKKTGGERVPENEDIVATGKSVVVIGGGDTGSDCIGTSLRQGAKKVLQIEIMPKPPKKRPDTTPWPEWPNVLKETSSHKEGGTRRWCVNTVEIKGDGERVTSLVAEEIEWKRGKDGRMQVVPVKGSRFEVKADLVLLAMGFVGPRRMDSLSEIGIKYDERAHIVKNELGMTSIEGVFVTGDMSTGQSLVVRAMADGRECARNIHEYLEQKKR